MNRSNVHLLDLPNEILYCILTKLKKIDVLYSLVGIGNRRLDLLVQDEQFSNTLELVLTDEIILSRFCNQILPQIHRNVKQLMLESPTLERILLSGTYPNLSYLKLHKFDQETLSQMLSSTCFSSL